MNISEEGLALIKKFEGCPVNGAGDPIAYLCPAGVWTIGYGHTKRVKEHDRWSKDHADFILREEIEDEYEKHIQDLVKVKLEQHQFDALVAFVLIPNQIKRWNKATVDGEKVVLDGLVRRREAESLLFEGKEWSEV